MQTSPADAFSLRYLWTGSGPVSLTPQLAVADPMADPESDGVTDGPTLTMTDDAANNEVHVSCNAPPPLSPGAATSGVIRYFFRGVEVSRQVIPPGQALPYLRLWKPQLPSTDSVTSGVVSYAMGSWNLHFSGPRSIFLPGTTTGVSADHVMMTPDECKLVFDPNGWQRVVATEISVASGSTFRAVRLHHLDQNAAVTDTAEHRRKVLITQDGTHLESVSAGTDPTGHSDDIMVLRPADGHTQAQAQLKLGYDDGFELGLRPLPGTETPSSFSTVVHGRWAGADRVIQSTTWHKLPPAAGTGGSAAAPQLWRCSADFSGIGSPPIQLLLYQGDTLVHSSVHDGGVTFDSGLPTMVGKMSAASPCGVIKWRPSCVVHVLNQTVQATSARLSCGVGAGVQSYVIGCDLSLTGGALVLHDLTAADPGGLPPHSITFEPSGAVMLTWDAAASIIPNLTPMVLSNADLSPVWRLLGLSDHGALRVPAIGFFPTPLSQDRHFYMLDRGEGLFRSVPW
jgi:hypothetical protein